MGDTGTSRYDVAVIGGGVIGLAVAHALTERRADRRIVVIEAQTGSREASWAAAGMLAPYSEFHTDSPLYRLCRDSADLYPEYARQLREETGLPCTLVDTGSLLVRREDADGAEIDVAMRFLRTQRVELELLEGAALREREPGLSATIERALWLPERSVNNRQLWDALAEACRRRGVELRLGTAVTHARIADARIEMLDTASGAVEADTVVVAAGAWSQALGILLGVEIPIVPVKGQMLRFDVPDDTVRHTVHRGSTYVVPRPGYGVIVGTTMEDRGFDHTVEDRAIAALAAGAALLVPALGKHAPCETWSGHRPKPPDGLPILGYAPGRSNLVLATGHFRNGILLTPITGRIVTDVIDRTGMWDIRPFDPARFSRT